MKIFVRGVVDTNGVMSVQYTHFNPLDKKDGLSEDILKTGYLTEAEYPDMNTAEGEVKELYYDTQKDKFEVKVLSHNKPMTTDEKIDLLIQMMLESEGLL